MSTVSEPGLCPAPTPTPRNPPSEQAAQAPHVPSLLTGSTKGALDTLTKVMAVELGPHKVSPSGTPPIAQSLCSESLSPPS